MGKIMNLPDIQNNEKLIQFKNLILIILIIIDLIFIVAITLFDIPTSDLEFMAIFDLFVCILLAINLGFEYIDRDCSTLQFLKDLFRVLRIVQFFQVIRIFNIQKTDIRSFKFFVQNQLLRTLSIILIIYMVLSSIILFAIDDSFTSIFDSFWYGLVTITGVGYGDITPISNQGKVIGMLTIIIGVLFISIFTAAMSGLYMEKNEEETRSSIKKHIDKTQKENECLKREIKEIKDETVKLNKKIDELTKMLNKD